jgi:protein SCO1
MAIFKSKKLYGILLVLITFFMFFFINSILVFFNDAGKIEKKITTNFKFLQQEQKTIVLLYFGYTYCPDVCVLALNRLNKLYPLIDKEKVSIYFINLLDEVSLEDTKNYVHSFNKDFNAISLDKKELLTVTNQLKVSFSKSIFNKKEMNHSSFLYLLTKKEDSYLQKYVYLSNSYDLKMITDDISNILKDY